MLTPLLSASSDLGTLRDCARKLLQEIGWARGEFGGLIVLLMSCESCADTTPEIRACYTRMNETLGNRVIREQLYVPDEETGDYKPRVDSLTRQTQQAVTMNPVTQCLAAVSEFNEVAEPLVLEKTSHLSTAHAAINAALQLWCEQFTETPIPEFDGVHGFGFDGRFKDRVYADEHLVRIEVVGPDEATQNVVAQFECEVDDTCDFEMTFPLRYLDRAFGAAAIQADAQKLKKLLLNQ